MHSLRFWTCTVFSLFFYNIYSYGWVSVWDNWSLHEKKDLCYIASTPTDKEPKSIFHGRVYLGISYWKDYGFQIFLKTFYDINPSYVSYILFNDGSRYNLFSHVNQLSYDFMTKSHSIIHKMKRGEKIRIFTQSQKKIHTSYNFSLYGFTSAFNALNELCVT